MFFCSCTIEQIRDLAMAVREGFGPGFSRAALIDCILLLLEDIPGVKAGNVEERLIELAWAIYIGLPLES
ncbi:hypothetical protein WJ23_04605 [Burkholderia lata]|uniref:hypothetical protein n=2 Tax=Burkholderiaceae TaxID=119060 RepID=UPI0008420EE8|nr:MULTISPECIES: hypothetical protein [Burkholderia]AOJ37227.1 hypothetical protein WJ23_04605 [Burkholderia lata]OXJ38421.1 hypothetical protein CFB82_04890 [Burkholderia sp. HI2714]